MNLKDKEVWKRIRGFKDYEVSTFGNIRKVKTGKLIAKYLLFGRNAVAISKNGKQHHLYVDNLVAYTFLPIPYGISEPKIYHKNKNYTDDKLVNLHFKKNVQTNSVLIVIYLFKNDKCYRKAILSFRRAMDYLNCKEKELLHALAHTSIIKNDGKEYKVEYNFSKL